MTAESATSPHETVTPTESGLSACRHTRTELFWAGKRTQVERIALPFQRVETVNAPRGADV